jgi:hypothetical protein
MSGVFRLHFLGSLLETAQLNSHQTPTTRTRTRLHDKNDGPCSRIRRSELLSFIRLGNCRPVADEGPEGPEGPNGRGRQVGECGQRVWSRFLLVFMVRKNIGYILYHCVYTTFLHANSVVCHRNSAYVHDSSAIETVLLTCLARSSATAPKLAIDGSHVARKRLPASRITQIDSTKDWK